MSRTSQTAGAWEGLLARTLGAIARVSTDLAPVARKRELDPGDLVVVRTRNSIYYLRALGGDSFNVSGGWFSRSPCPQPITVAGCTFGGRAICTDLVAARGLFLEFGNNVSTTRIRDVRILRGDEPATASAPNLPN